jgi:flavin-dependent dehydrogenase
VDGRSLDADVVVVGGGPAGAATAIACAARGLRVILCEREKLGRDRPGETLHPGAEALLAQLGMADQLVGSAGARHPGIWIEWGGARRFEPFGGDAGNRWQGFQVWRADFDARLVERARGLGVDVRRPSTVTGLIANEGAVRGVETESGPIAARMVVDATGAARRLARALGVASPPRSPRLIARYGYAGGACPARDEAPLLVGDASGWTWSARVRRGVYQWTSVRFGSRSGGGAPEEFRDLTPMGPARGADVTWRMTDRAAGPGWFIVGDAAATLDPTSSHGVLKALLSGITAGHLIAAGLDGKAPGGEIAAAYHEWIAGWFAADAAHLRAFYRSIGATGFGEGSAQRPRLPSGSVKNAD